LLYGMNEGSGTTVVDTSGNNHTGSLVNGPTWVAGQATYGQALSFDGVNDAVSVANPSTLNFGTSDFTIELWAQRNVLGGGQRHLFSGTIEEVGACGAVAREISSALKPGAILSDVASIKAPIMDRARSAGLEARFAGAHPLAGTHGSGFGAARPDLFRGAVVYICSTGTREGDTVARAVASFWELVAEAQPVTIDATAHDVQLAWTSHLPQAVSSALAAALGAQSLGGVSFGPGGRDTTRLAASDPALWAEIFLANAGPVTEALGKTGDTLQQLRTLIAARDAAGLTAFLAQGAVFRRGLDR